MLLYLFDGQTVICFCLSMGDDQRRSGEDVMFCNARLCFGKMITAADANHVCKY